VGVGGLCEEINCKQTAVNTAKNVGTALQFQHNYVNCSSTAENTNLNVHGFHESQRICWPAEGLEIYYEGPGFTNVLNADLSVYEKYKCLRTQIKISHGVRRFNCSTGTVPNGLLRHAWNNVSINSYCLTTCRKSKLRLHNFSRQCPQQDLLQATSFVEFIMEVEISRFNNLT
jgi:hypothetical protein